MILLNALAFLYLIVQLKKKDELNYSDFLRHTVK